MKIKGHYILYNEPDSDGRKTIYIRYYKSGFAIKRSTGFKVLPSDWDSEAGLFVPSSPAAKRLNRRLKYVLELTDSQGQELPDLRPRQTWNPSATRSHPWCHNHSNQSLLRIVVPVALHRPESRPHNPRQPIHGCHAVHCCPCHSLQRWSPLFCLQRTLRENRSEISFKRQYALSFKYRCTFCHPYIRMKTT